MNKKGFTLVELLAVIAILAILVIIALPNVLSMFNQAKKDTFLTETKNIYKEIAKKYISESMKGNKITEINSNDDSKLDMSTSGIDYCATLDKSGNVLEFVVANGTYYIQLDNVSNVNMITSDKVSEGALDELGCGVVRYGVATTYIRKLYNDETKRNANGLKKDNTKDKNIRYAGNNPNNYVSFNGELWRIIGVFGDNVKLVRSKMLGNLAWDYSADSKKNNSLGINEWSQADIKNYLNDKYFSGNNINCYNKTNTTTCPSGNLNDTAKNMINDQLWNTGGIDIDSLEDEETSSIYTVKVYEAERGNKSGKSDKCYNGNYCNDTVERTTTWNGYVGLPYVTDWAYASSEKVCETNLDDGYDVINDSFDDMTCKKNNWMHFSGENKDSIWTISPAISYGNYTAIAIYDDGGIGEDAAYTPMSIYPTVYLKSTVKIVAGQGTSSNPYTLEL